MNEHPFCVDTVRSCARAYGIVLDDRACDLLAGYAGLVREWSRRTNLVSSRDLDRFSTYHILDSLKIASCMSIPEHGRLLDFGSGAGLPGIPLAIAYPGLETILVDSRRKRGIFLEAVVNDLGLPNVSVMCSRLESVDRVFDTTFDLVTTRGTVSLDVFYQIAGRFLVRGGSLVSIKGESIDDEQRSLDPVVDRKLFNILYTRPAHVDGVRDGSIVIITRE